MPGLLVFFHLRICMCFSCVGFSVRLPLFPVLQIPKKVFMLEIIYSPSPLLILTQFSLCGLAEESE
jgi:hypothetical protein